MKYKVISLNLTLIFLIAVLFAAFGGALCVTHTAVTTNTEERLLPIYSVETDKKQIAITFDAAWSAGDTDKLIEILKKHNAKATVFCVGDWIRNNPDAVKKFHNSGHEIGNHSDTHALFGSVSTDKVEKEIKNCNEEIKKVIGKTPILCRAPSGDYDNKSIQICEKAGMKMIQWDVDSLDWKKLSVDEMYNRVTEKVQNGSIILFHNGVENTPEALDKILTKLENDGYEFVTVSELIYWDNYEIDHTGRQHKITKE